MAKDFRKLIGIIAEKYGTRAAFCAALGKAPEWLSRRLNNQTEFTADDIIIITDTLVISPEDIHVYFFTKNVV